MRYAEKKRSCVTIFVLMLLGAGVFFAQTAYAADFPQKTWAIDKPSIVEHVEDLNSVATAPRAFQFQWTAQHLYRQGH